MRLKVGIIGAGGRVMQTIIPAIWALGNKAELVHINARSSRPVCLPDNSEITTLNSLDQISLEHCDVIIIAVGTDKIRPVVDELSCKKYKERVTLVMDTPPLRLSDYHKSQIFSGFKNVAVGEDWVTLSPIMAMQNIIASGDIGDLCHIQMDHMSYRYHGLAALKKLASVKTISSIKRIPLGNSFFETRVNLKSGVTATVIDPRDYDNGRMRITGTKGTISDYKITETSGTKFEIQYTDAPNGWHQPFSINNKVHPMDNVETYMTTLPFDHLIDGSRVNRLKIRAYARLLEDIANGIPNYPIRDGLYDYLAIACAEKFGHFRDITFSNNQNSAIRSLIPHGT